MRNLIIDTRPLVALLDRSEQKHQPCADFLEGFSGRLLTTEAVVTEATYLLQKARGGPSACLKFVESEAVAVVPNSREGFERCRLVMEKYDDIPMDYADATLVVLAEDVGTQEIFTLDRRGFSSYRLQDGKAFTIYP